MMRSSIVFGSQPRSVIVGDLNNDHQLDIVVANSGTNTIGIFMANNNGTFTNQITYSTGVDSHPYSIAISDFNNDTYLDIVVANYGINSLGIFLGNKNGTVKNQTLLSLDSSRPIFIDVADFNKDNRMDIVIVNNGSNTISILLGYGNGSFQNQITYSTDYDSLPTSLTIADLNNDNQLDIAVANYGTNNIGIFFGYDNGSFSNQRTYTTTRNSKPSSIAVGDFNNDKQLDIVVTNYGTGNIGIFFGYDNGSFLPQIIYALHSHSYPQYITVGDMNNDNQLDLIIIDSINGQIHIIPGYGNGSFASITTYDSISGSNPFGAALGDFNNNNQSDLVVVNYGTNDVLILNDYFIKPSTRQINYDVGTQGTTNLVTFGDFNSDHIPDIISYQEQTLIILLGFSNGTFGNEITIFIGNQSNIQYLYVEDLNNDNLADIIIADGGYHGVDVLLGYGNGSFTEMTTYPSRVDSFLWLLAVGDLNQDNQLDIVFTDTQYNDVGILFGDGTGTFSNEILYTVDTGSPTYGLAVDDINNDNYTDIVVGHSSSSLTILFGYGDGTFIIMGTFSTNMNSRTNSLILADLNRDNDLDIVVANPFTDNFAVFLGYGDGNFADPTIYSSGSASEPYHLMVTDFNNDNISDIAVASYGNSAVLIFYGFGNGSFQLTRTYSTGFASKPFDINAVYFNDDKQLEIIVALEGIGAIGVLTEYKAAKFINQTKYSTGSAPKPLSVATGNFNNDNRPDIVVANAGTGDLSILFGTNNDTFDMEIIYRIGTDSQPQYVITCDINKDNQTDIISVNLQMNSISLILGYGNGSFAEQMIYPTGSGSNPYAISSGDLNNDTQLDLVVANTGTNNIGIFFGFNYRSFLYQTIPLSNSRSGSRGIVVSDFNNDNYPDIAAIYFSTSRLDILLGYGNGSFTVINSYLAGFFSSLNGIAADDFNNDNQSDLVIVSIGSDSIGVFLGYGNGSFAHFKRFSAGNNSFPISVINGDLNNDGRLDIVTANYGSETVGILLGYGNGTFSIVNIYSTGKGSTPNAVTLGDFNDDDRLDIAAANYGTDCIGVFLGYGDGTFTNQRIFSSGYRSSPLSITIGDFNRDNKVDIAVANFRRNDLGILLGYGDGTFADVTSYSTGDGSTPYQIGIGDFNNDNISDIAVANYGTSNMVVLFGFGDGTFLLGIGYSTGIGSEPWSLAIGDFNRDGRLDIAVANYLANNIGLFLGYGIQPLAGITLYDAGTGSQPHSVAIGNFNNDVWLDIVVANYGTNNVGILLGRSNTKFQDLSIYSTGKDSAPYSVAIADFNNDTYLDIVIINSNTDNIYILFGYGNGTFRIGTTYSTGTRAHPHAIAISDFNNDNIWDIVITNTGTSNIYFLYGYGNGTFGNASSRSLDYGYLPNSVATQDLNGDGWIDIVIACYGTNHVETLIKMC